MVVRFVANGVSAPIHAGRGPTCDDANENKAESSHGRVSKLGMSGGEKESIAGIGEKAVGWWGPMPPFPDSRMTPDPNAERRSPIVLAIRLLIGAAAILVCVAFSVLWAASARYAIGAGTNHIDISTMSYKGKVLVQFNPAGVDLFDDWYVGRYEMDAQSNGFWRTRPPFGIGLDRNGFVDIHFQHWFAIALGIIATFSAFAFSWRFNIRTLLIATAIASALLTGIVVANNLPQWINPAPGASVPSARNLDHRNPASLEKVWPGNWYQRAAEMLQVDLGAAQIPYETDEGFLDFHALRATFITSLVRAGVHPKIVQTLARHSQIELTMQAYTKLTSKETASALSALPKVETNVRQTSDRKRQSVSAADRSKGQK
jgi:hypothetical protein